MVMRSVAAMQAAAVTVAEWSGNSVVHAEASPACSAYRAASTVSAIPGREMTMPSRLMRTDHPGRESGARRTIAAVVKYLGSKRLLVPLIEDLARALPAQCACD